MAKKLKRNMDVEWSYEGANGPENWHTLCDWFAKGATFPMQSPINLVHAEISQKNVVSEQLTFHYKSELFTEKEFKNTIHFVPFNTESYVIYQGVEYYLTDIHFHRPSEHIIDGEYQDMEFHLVHTSAQQKNLVVGVLCTFDQEGVDPQTMDPSSQWDYIEHKHFFSPQFFLPQQTAHFHYEGSLTTPPTMGPIPWFVFDTIQKINPSFLDEFHDEILEINNRPIQDRQDRTIYYFDK